MSRPSVYLAGPITGLSFADSVDWRGYAARRLGDLGIDAFSPLRFKTYLKDETSLKDSYDHNPLSTGRGIVTRDRFDTSRRDVILVNLLGAERVSIGTVMEIAWADMRRTPIVLVMEPSNIHKHSMLLEAAGYVVDDLDLAINIVAAILLPGGENQNA